MEAQVIEEGVAGYNIGQCEMWCLVSCNKEWVRNITPTEMWVTGSTFFACTMGYSTIII